MQSQHTNHQQAVSSKLNKFDLAWVLNLFGTAVGAGVLFLPINAGMSGFWPLVAMAVIVGPMTYFSHRGLARFVLSSAKPGSDITEVVEEHFGKTAGKLITLLYFFAIFPILLIYVRRRQLLPELALAFAPPQRRKLYQLLHKFIPV